jgi:hypothetical protein
VRATGNTRSAAAAADKADGGGLSAEVGRAYASRQGQRPLNRRRACRLVTDGPTATPRGGGGSGQTDGCRTIGP